MLTEEKISKQELLWQGVIILAVLVTALEGPWSFTFQTKLQNWQLWSDAIISLIFVADIIYQLRMAKKRRAKGRQAKHSKAFNRFSFGIDIVASIPFDVISYVFQLSQGVQIIRLIRLFRLLRIVKIFSVMGNFTLVPRPVKMGLIALSSIIVVHFITCIWIKIYPPELGADHISYYIRSLYWSITTLTTIGYGDITPNTDGGRIFTMFIQVLGVGVYGVVIGQVSRMFVEADKHEAQTREKIHDLNLFMKHYSVPRKTQLAVFNYYSHLLNKRLSDNDHKIISDLPHALQQELQTYMNVKLIGGLSIFQSCSSNCLKAVASALKQKVFSPGQLIIKKDEIGQEMFIIGHGSVDVVGDEGQIFANIPEGNFFGELALIKETKRNANVRAQSYCDLYVLEKEDFLEIIERYPELLKNMEPEIQKRAG